MMWRQKIDAEKVLQCTYVDPFSSDDIFELGVIARLNRFFFRNEPCRVLTLLLSAIEF